MESKKIYNIVNSLVLAITCAVFVCGFAFPVNDFLGGGKTPFVLKNGISDSDIFSIIISVVLILIVHIFKQIRMMLVIYGLDISVFENIKVYCKTTFVNMVLPYKLGELFRMYCYGRLLKDRIRGIIIVLFDRFVDTVALVVLLFLVSFFGTKPIAGLTWLLLLFLSLVFAFYKTFPNLYNFWNDFLLKSKATPNRLLLLKILYALNSVYLEIRRLTRGRGEMTCVLSMLAWIAEVSAVIAIDRLVAISEIYSGITEYLTSSINGIQAQGLIRFRLVSVLLLFLFYMVVKIQERVNRRKKMKCVR